MSIETLYQELCGPETPANYDIREHLPTLRSLAEDLGPEAHITEFGVRGAVSTVVWLSGKPKKLVCYDLFRSHRVDQVEKLANGTDFCFHRQDVLKADIEETDLLFIDTWHAYEQLKEELRLHAHKVRKYIVLHDTTSYGEVGEGGGRGLWPAVEEFLKNDEWRLKERFFNNNGLTILERQKKPSVFVSYKDHRYSPSSIQSLAKQKSPYRVWLQDVKTAGHKSQYIARATPIRPHATISAFCAQANESLLWPLNTGKTLLLRHDKEGNEIAEARNAIVDEAMDFETTGSFELSHILWIDDDVLPMRGALMQLLKHDADIASGTYFSKVPDPGSQPLIFPLKGHGPITNFIPDKAFEVWGHGMGLTLVKLSVYKRMRDELDLPPDKYGRPEWYKTTLGTPIQEEHTVSMGSTEDFWFLNHADKLGIKRIVDTSKHAFGFHIDPQLNCGYPEEQWKSWIKGGIIVWQTAKGEVVWD